MCIRQGRSAQIHPVHAPGGLDILLAPQQAARYIQAMRCFRVFLFLLLAIAVPVQGYAHFALLKVPCPMEQDSTMDEMTTAAMHDCCDDADTAAPAGKACKSDLSCQSCHSAGSLLLIPECAGLPQNLASSVHLPHLADIDFTFDPAATWRPPAQR